MAPPKVSDKNCPINCNYLEGRKDQLCSQLDEFNEGLVIPLIRVASDPEDDNYCAYQSVGSGEIIKPVAFQNGYYHLNGAVWPEGDYLYFRVGEVPEDVATAFKSRLAATESGYQIAAYHVLVRNEAGFGPNAEIFNQEGTAIAYLNAEFGSAIIGYYGIPLGRYNGRQEYILYVAGYNLPEAIPQFVEEQNRPPLELEYCPEWVRHESEVESQIPVEGWVLSSKEKGVYQAIPRGELKEEISEGLNTNERYAYDLRSKLGFHAYIRGDDPVRLLEDVRFVGEGGVRGLICPEFEVLIHEIEKRPENCLEWVERKKEEDIRKGQAVTDYKDGYLLDLRPGVFKYVAATGKLDLSEVKSFVAGKRVRSGYETVVRSDVLVEDSVCSAYELKAMYRKIPELVEMREKESLPRGKTDKDKLLARFANNPQVQKKIRVLGELGEITWAPPVGKEPGQGADLISIMKRRIHEEEKRPRLEVMLVVDGSGSMKDDTRYVREKLEDLAAEMKVSADEGGMGLLGFVDDQFSLLVPLNSLRPLEGSIPYMIAGLTYIDEKMDGGVEYIYEAAKQALDHLEESGKKGSVQKILLLTDEAGDTKDEGETLKSMRERADRLGVKFEIVFITDSGGMSDGRQLFLQYLDMAGIDFLTMTLEERMQLWERMLNDTLLANSAKKIVIEKVAREKHSESLRILSQALQDSDWGIRQVAAEGLGKFNDPKAMQALLEALKDSDRDVRRAAAEGLGKFNDPKGMQALREALKDSDWNVRQAAAEGLDKFSDPKGMQALLEALKDSARDVRLAAAEGLGKFNDPKGMQALLEALKDSDWRVRQAAVKGLGKFNDPKGMQALREALKDSEWYVRQAAMEGLGEFNDPKGMQALLDMLKDSEWYVRQAAAEGLGKFNDPRAMQALLDALKDSNWSVRQAAVKGLGKSNDPRAMQALLDALKDSEWYVRRVAAEGLGKIGTSDVIPHLSEVLFDPHSDVIQAATEAIEAIEAIEAREMIQ